MASSQGPSMQQPSGPPYPPQIWSLGGKAEVNVDVPITAVLLAFYIAGAVTHMTIFQLNRRKSHKFIFSALLFGFCMARITTCILRIASTCLPHNVRLAIAAQIFVAAGVLLVFIVNLIFTQRLIRAQHPNWGWHNAFSMFFKVHYALIVATLAMLITVVVQSFYTLNPNIRRIDRDIQLYGVTYFMYVSFLPIPLMLLSLAIPRSSPIDKFGTGRFRTKIAILLTSATLLSFGAAYRCGLAYLTPVPRTQPLPPYYHKAAFYIVNFVVEILVIYLYAILRVDIRFHIPDGARGHGAYSSTSSKTPVVTPTKTTAMEFEFMRSRISVYTEDEAFDNRPISKVLPEEPSRPISKVFAKDDEEKSIGK